MDLKNKHILITGASRGIGEAIAYSLHKAGAKSSLVARMSESLDLVAEKVKGRAYPMDLANLEEVRQLVSSVQEQSGAIHVLVNNAAIAKPKSFFAYGKIF